MLKKINKEIKKAKSIAIFTHINPDCDGMGSMCALYYYIKHLHKVCDMFVCDTFRNEYSNILPTKEFKEKINQEYDLVIVVDVGVTDRLGAYSEYVKNHNNVIVFDHHLTNKEGFAKYNYVDATAPACANIIYKFLKKNKVKISKEIATCLYTGIVSDTGSFINTNTTSQCLKEASELVKYGADLININHYLFRFSTFKELKLKSLMLNKIEIISNCIALTVVNQKDFKSTGTEKKDTAEFYNTLLSIEGMKAGILVSEKKPNDFTISFRSVAGVDIRKLAERLGGGGHKNAAGASIIGPESEVRKKVIKAIKEEFDDK